MGRCRQTGQAALFNGWSASASHTTTRERTSVAQRTGGSWARPAPRAPPVPAAGGVSNRLAVPSISVVASARESSVCRHPTASRMSCAGGPRKRVALAATELASACTRFSRVSNQAIMSSTALKKASAWPTPTMAKVA